MDKQASLGVLRPEAIPAHIIGVCKKLRDAGFEAWLVGGAVRDLIRGRDAHDFDVATSAQPNEVTNVFGRRHVIPTGEKHGTVTVLVNRPSGDRHDFATSYEGESMQQQVAFNACAVVCAAGQ